MSMMSKRADAAAREPIWRAPDGSAIACVEKIKVLESNLAELRQMAQDAFEDAILMGCDPDQARAILVDAVRSLANPYADPTE